MSNSPMSNKRERGGAAGSSPAPRTGPRSFKEKRKREEGQEGEEGQEEEEGQEKEAQEEQQQEEESPAAKRPRKACASASSSSSSSGSFAPAPPAFGVDSTHIPGITPGVRLRAFQSQDVKRIFEGWEEMDSGSWIGSRDKAHQLIHTRHNGHAKGVVLAHEMGLGKTLIALSALACDMSDMRAAFSQMGEDAPKLQALIIVPNSVLWNWKSEIDKFFQGRNSPFQNVLVVHRSNTQVDSFPSTAAELRNYDALITTFGTLASSSIHNLAEQFEYLIVDEAHRLRNKKTENHKLMLQVRNKVRKMILLTGTPINNDLEDLVSLIALLGVERRFAKRALKHAMNFEAKAARAAVKVLKSGVGAIFNSSDDEDEHGNDDTPLDSPSKGGSSSSSSSSSSLHLLPPPPPPAASPVQTEEQKRNFARMVIDKCVLRRNKADILVGSNKPILELPKKVLATLSIKLRGKFRDAYMAIEGNAREMVEKITELKKKKKIGHGEANMRLIALLTRLRQATNHPELCLDKGDEKMLRILAPVRPIPAVSSKMKAILATCKDLFAKKEKIVVFSQFVNFLDRLQKHLGLTHCDDRRTLFQPNKYPSFARIDGSVDTRGRQDQVDRFQNDPRCAAILISLAAGAEGITLTASRTIMIIDPWWNPQLIEQAIDRVHRIGQNKEVNVIHMLAAGTVDERVHHIAARKHHLAHRVLGDSVSASSKFWEKSKRLTSSELKYLLLGGEVVDYESSDEDEYESDSEAEEDDIDDNGNCLSLLSSSDSDEDEECGSSSRKSSDLLSLSQDSIDDSFLDESFSLE